MFLHALAGVIAAAHPSGVACGALFRVAGNQTPADGQNAPAAFTGVPESKSPHGSTALAVMGLRQ